MPADDAFDATLSADALDELEARGPILPPGAVLAERYEVLELLGQGAMGEVYRVHDRDLDEPVALKRLRHASGEHAVERFLAEVKLSRRVTHRHVARTFDVGVHEGRPFLTMELLEGQTLEAVLEARGRLPEEEALPIAEAILEGLGAAHDAEVVHRDLKPANVMVTEDGRVVLSDFGIARALHGPTLTHQAQLVGTPLYMAPEQVRGEPVDHRADLYAFGVMLFEMLTGRSPFQGDSPVAIALARLSNEPPDPRSLAPVSDGTAGAVLRCMARAPADRFEDVAALQDALRGGGCELPPPPKLDEQSLAVLPFGYRGDADSDYLGEALAEELVDVLGRVRGLRMVAFAATIGRGPQAEPRETAAALDVAHVVHGTVQRRGPRVRITVRLVAADGTQRWTERFEGVVEDVFALQEEMSQRIAEALRLELGTVRHAEAPREAIELYFRARRSFLVDGYDEVAGPLGELETCIALAPGFTPAYALHAAASARSWFTSVLRQSHGEAGPAAERSVARALERAPEHPDTHLARGILALQRIDLPEAARALAHAVELAPTLALAHLYLGQLQLEAGQVAQAESRLRAAMSLDPTIAGMAQLHLARIHFWRGDAEGFAAQLEGVRQLSEGSPLQVARVRATAWSGEPRWAEAARADLGQLGPGLAHLVVLADYALGEHAPAAVDAQVEAFLETVDNARFAAFVRQILVELHTHRDAPERALAHLEKLVEGGLADLDWLLRCPTFAELREHPLFRDAIRQVRVRARSVIDLDVARTATWSS
ncbi:MAG TPA: protein kinase [Polyangiaceae bacterium LLY-WYZ-15_(1-7)]|nr:serine/threonine protein kinase [Myxococcales bacterium]MAT25441.1 serine/threonine protein kinase [Sandaracinus sp.]HJL00673.1 protein kinase [Polyangiaceae bacterium LLY-WYZ-15_(1-7)]HJL08975.1 protein kinase [Polyangiaceae bacterium LLY-WYZ-15_(1-7)]